MAILTCAARQWIVGSFAFLVLCTNVIQAFVPRIARSSSHAHYASFSCSISPSVLLHAGPGDTGEVGSGPNWIERSFPVDMGGAAEKDSTKLKKVEDYNLGISGVSYETGPLSKRMFDAIMANNDQTKMSDEIKSAFTLYAMDFTAKEATKAALKQNGLEMVLEEDMEDEGLWGDVASVQLLDPDTNKAVGPVYETTDEAIENWTPGQGFNFVVRQVPAKIRELSLDELLHALDPDGKLREEAKERGMTMPDEEITTLQALANDCMRRSQFAPQENENDQVFGGLDKRGYRVISRSDLLRDSVNADGTENSKTLMHVMDALVSHGALVVDLTDGGTTYKLAIAMASMWNRIQDFYKKMDESPELAESLPGMTPVEEAGSAQAKVGYASYKDGAMQFLETLYNRNDFSILPKEAQSILGNDGTKALHDAFQIVADVGKDVVRIATAASSMEANAFVGVSGDDDDDGPSISGLSVLSAEDDEDGTSAAISASQAAALMADELLDDGRPLEASGIHNTEGSVSMSPHRLCRYRYNKNDTNLSSVCQEVFGAHTDSTFVTMVPVAEVSGLEVFDEDAELWYRPELMARKQWELERESRAEDSAALFETIPAVQDGQEEIEIPWHARYLVVMPGELLQLSTRNEIPSAVHRVVAVKDGPARLSAPILLRGRPGTKMDVERYLGTSDNAGTLLSQCDGMSMQELHNAMQPSSFQ